MADISALTSLSSLSDLIGTKSTSSVSNGNELPFQSMFEDAINNVVQTQSDVDQQAILLATGQSDDVHNLSIASTKASLSLDLLVELRNKTIDAYNELMRMNV
ncbi:MAG: flagellar hook-basal body complex protein FliE [Anaerofustis sp.]